MRLPLSVTVHADRYDDRRFEEELEAYDRRREAAEPTPPEKQRMREQLDRILHSSRYEDVLQESYFAQREGRYVLPVKADMRGRIPGIVHDVSASGATISGGVPAGAWRPITQPLSHWNAAAPRNTDMLFVVMPRPTRCSGKIARP